MRIKSTNLPLEPVLYPGNSIGSIRQRKHWARGNSNYVFMSFLGLSALWATTSAPQIKQMVNKCFITMNSDDIFQFHRECEEGIRSWSSKFSIAKTENRIERNCWTHSILRNSSSHLLIMTHSTDLTRG